MAKGKGSKYKSPGPVSRITGPRANKKGPYAGQKLVRKHEAARRALASARNELDAQKRAAADAKAEQRSSDAAKRQALLERSRATEQAEASRKEMRARMAQGGKKAGQVIAQERAAAAKMLGASNQNLRRMQEERKRVGEGLNWSMKRVQSLNAELQTLKASGRDADQARINALTTEKSQLQERMGQLRDMQGSLATQIRDHEATISGLRENLNQFGERMQAAEEGLARESGKVTARNRQIRQLRAERNAAIREVEALRARGMNTQGAEARVEQINQIMQEGGGVRLTEDGRLIRTRDGVVISYGHNAAGGLGEARNLLSEPQFNRLMEAIEGAGGGNNPAAQDALRARIAAIESSASLSREQKQKMILKESDIEEKKKTSSEKFAAGAKNFGEGMGGISRGFGAFLNPAAMSGLLMIVVIILLTWIVLQLFPIFTF
jgi:hypothetical protein